MVCVGDVEDVGERRGEQRDDEKGGHSDGAGRPPPAPRSVRGEQHRGAAVEQSGGSDHHLQLDQSGRRGEVAARGQQERSATPTASTERYCV